MAIYQVWAAVLFEVWKECNRRSRDGTTLLEVVLIRNMRMVKDKDIALFNTGHSLGADLNHFWSFRP
ncbi:unnamed protein product [Brassica oleracea]